MSEIISKNLTTFHKLSNFIWYGIWYV